MNHLSKPRTTGLLFSVLATLLLTVFAPGVRVACNCISEGQCVYGTCCFVHNGCMPDGKLCTVYGEVGEKECWADGSCTYQGGSCGA